MLSGHAPEQIPQVPPRAGRDQPQISRRVNRDDLAVLAFRLARRLMASEEPILARHDMPMWSSAVLTALRDGPTRSQAALATAIGTD